MDLPFTRALYPPGDECLERTHHDVVHAAMLYFFVVISLSGVQENRLRSHGRSRRLNIKLLLMLLLKLSGFKFYFTDLGFLCPVLPVYGVTILVQRISLPIQFFISI
jgi:hypothetical protein